MLQRLARCNRALLLRTLLHCSAVAALKVLWQVSVFGFTTRH